MEMIENSGKDRNGIKLWEEDGMGDADRGASGAVVKATGSR